MQTDKKILALLLTISASGCGDHATTAKGTAEGDTCEQAVGCESPLICAEGTCHKICENDSNCAKDQTCENGICHNQSNPICRADADCKMPSACQIVRDAFCEGARCHYQPRAAGELCNDDDICTVNDACDGAGNCVGTPEECNTPPSSVCDADDMVYHTYKTPGICYTADDLGCIYEQYDQECADCLKNCAGFCDNVVCEQQANSCLVNICDPHSTATPPCSAINKEQGSACKYDADSDGVMDNGYCDRGECKECTQDSHCVNTASDWPECYVGKCENNKCTFTFNEDATCGKKCLKGVKYGNGLCTIDESTNEISCFSNKATSCNGYTCNADNSDCRTDCQEDSHCILGNYCSEGQCTGAKGIGDSCNSNNECGSGFCENSICCTEDCAEGYSCSADGLCRADNGHKCQDGNECYSGHCIDNYCCNNVCGECQACNIAGSEGSCTDVSAGNRDDSCMDSDKTCNGAGQCLILNGATCSDDDQCISSHCIDSHCCKTTARPANVCSGNTLKQYTCSTNGEFAVTKTDICPNNLKCNAQGTDCLKQCSSAADCTNNTCANGVCKLANGAKCTNGTECASGYCLQQISYFQEDFSDTTIGQTFCAKSACDSNMSCESSFLGNITLIVCNCNSVKPGTGDCLNSVCTFYKQ